MKTTNYLLTVLFLLPFFFFLSSEIKANWKNTNIKSESKVFETVNSQETDNKESLPEGVTDDWLNSLEDENGNKIISNQSDQPYQLPDDPEGDALQRKNLTGFNAGDQFGYSVSSVGDVNGDGYDDVIVGAFANDAGGANAGRAYIYFGGIILNVSVDVILTGEAADDIFGYTVSSAGDVNGDGYSDVIVGGPYNDAGGANAGRAYIYFGGASMNNTADVIMTGQTAGDEFGISVSTAGDVNGDGYSDVIVGARFNDAGGANAGRAYIFFGGLTMNNSVDVTLTGAAAGDQFGNSVSAAGDVNGDGFGDVIIGAYLNDAGGGNAGRVYIYLGGSSMNNISDVTMTGAASGDQFGYSVSSAGDVNGDGYSDVIAGATQNDAGGSNAGRAYVYFGGPAMNNFADVILTGEAPGDSFGVSVSTAGDVNGDGYSDLIAGAYFNDEAGANAGRAYVYFGGPAMNNISDVVMTGEAANDFFGNSVSSAGDVNGDGYSDIIAGANLNDGGGADAGRAYVYNYFMKNEIIHDLSMTGEAASDQFGYSVSSAGDVNGDGYSDVIVGAHDNNAGGSSAGRAYIYFGGASMNNIADVTMTGQNAGEDFGNSVSSAGDINGDGYDDVIIGAYFNSATGLAAGRAYIFYGGSSMNNTADVIMSGLSAGDNFGKSVSAAGDVNGDGYSDVIVGANNAGVTDAGQAYIYFGRTAMNNVIDVTLTGEAANDSFGWSVSSAGDVNGDGYSDVIVGAYSNDAGGASAGRAYIYYGGTAMNNTADVTMTGEAVNDLFGISVSTAGDVNGDGFPDVIIGAYQNDAGGNNAGRAYVYYGGAAMNNTADVLISGEAQGDGFGFSVSTAGDVNGDGIDDVIVGAYQSNTGGFDAGRAYIYFGGVDMNNTADVTMTGDGDEDRFGFSVSSTGDINGDGYDDFIAGAYLDDAGGSDAGRAFLYYGSAISVKPILNYVKDVPNDQGGKVILKWAKSSLEAYGVNNITNYLIYRSAPPGVSGYHWFQIADITAANFPFYYYEANTPADSSSTSNGNTYFLIKARNGNTGELWSSNILSGKSIDNIAPIMVSPFTAASSGSNVSLNWGPSTAPDFLNYIIYRSINPTIDPETAPVFATTTNISYLDTSPLSGLYYYFIVAQDIHNNKSPVAVAKSPGITLILKLYIEGFYNPTTDILIKDTVSVYLRNISAPYSIVDSSKGKVFSNGTFKYEFSNAPSGTYYIMLKHRNSIETWSKSGGEFMTQENDVTYIFTSTAARAFGNNQKQIDTSPVSFGIYSGDVNQDGTIDLSDGSLIDNDAFNFASGYLSTDVNGDEVIDLADAVFADNNGFNFVGKITP